MFSLSISGTIRSEETGSLLPGLPVRLFLNNKMLKLTSPAVSGEDGRYSLTVNAREKQDLLANLDRLSIKVSDLSDEEYIFSSAFMELYKEGDPSCFDISIPLKAFQKTRTKPVVTLTGEDHTDSDRFEIGDSLHLAATGLLPHTGVDIRGTGKDRELFSLHFRTDARGNIPSTILWAQVGLNDLESTQLLTYEEAAAAWKNRTVSISVVQNKKEIVRREISLFENKKKALAFASDKNGRPLNAIEGHKDPLFVSFRFTGTAEKIRVFLVSRQHDWNTGDAFEPAMNRRGKAAFVETDTPKENQLVTLKLASAGQLYPGAYDIIARPVRYGFEDNDALYLLDRDIITSRRITGLVIRENFWNAKPVLGGCVNKIPMSGRSLSTTPYFQYADTFTVGESIYGAMDPGIVDPGNISKMCALYVIQSKDDLTWNIDNSLTHLPQLGGNAAVQKVMMQPGCINYNKHLLWSNASTPGNYDIVADFGNNTGNAASFVQDDHYNTPLDIIDGYFTTGFRIVEDPGVMTQWANAGTWHYDENIVNALGLNGTTTITDENDKYFTPGNFIATNRTIQLKARVFYPADAAGVTDPSQISGVQADYPMIVIVHGNGHLFTNYDFLLDHFAKNGFIAASIDCRFLQGGFLVQDMHGLGRAETLFKHLEVLKFKFGAKVQNNIGLMGHSRGGEAVVKAARLNQQNGLGHNFSGVISLAPTDQYGHESLTGAWSKPYFMMYGSRDGDVSGAIYVSGYTIPQTGLAIWDRSSSPEKTTQFVYKATHNGFINDNHDSGDPDVLDPTILKKVTQAYMNAYFRMKLKNEGAQWNGMFTGEWKPASVIATGIEFYMQYMLSGSRTVDNFDGAINWQASTIGGTVTATGLPVNPEEGVLHIIDTHSPHDSQGMKIRWDSNTDKLDFSIPPAQKDVSGFTHLSIRITQKEGSASNPVNTSQNLRIALVDGTNKERAIRVSPFAAIPYPDQRPDASLRKSTMVTVRIPLKSYTIVCAGQVQVNLADITTVSLRFSEVATGEIDIDNIEFTN